MSDKPLAKICIWVLNAMRQLNFVVIFIVALALVLFSLQNTTPASIQIVPDLKVSAPIAVELILAMGLGAVLAWIFSVWSSLQKSIDMRNKNVQIQNLQETVQNLSVEIEERKRLVSSSAIDVEIDEDKSKN
jgi:putative membrane protein